MYLDYLEALPRVCLVGRGQALKNPVHVDDLMRGFLPWPTARTPAADLCLLGRRGDQHLGPRQGDAAAPGHLEALRARARLALQDPRRAMGATMKKPPLTWRRDRGPHPGREPRLVGRQGRHRPWYRSACARARPQPPGVPAPRASLPVLVGLRRSAHVADPPPSVREDPGKRLLEAPARARGLERDPREAGLLLELVEVPSARGVARRDDATLPRRGPRCRRPSPREARPALTESSGESSQLSSKGSTRRGYARAARFLRARARAARHTFAPRRTPELRGRSLAVARQRQMDRQKRVLVSPRPPPCPTCGGAQPTSAAGIAVTSFQKSTRPHRSVAISIRNVAEDRDSCRRFEGCAAWENRRRIHKPARRVPNFHRSAAKRAPFGTPAARRAIIVDATAPGGAEEGRETLVDRPARLEPSRAPSPRRRSRSPSSPCMRRSSATTTSTTTTTST
jgi:hypothetical protein